MLEVKDFFYETSLYEKIEMTEENALTVSRIFNMPAQFDGYCPDCQKETIFSLYHVDTADTYKSFDNLTFKFNENGSLLTRYAYCRRNALHVIYCIIHRKAERLPNGESKYIFQKIGQLPTVADLSSPDFTKYEKVLGKQRSGEFHKGIGLISHGIGIGSFVYLRRIFESLIEVAHSIAVGEGKCDEDKYNKSRMGEKITLLKDYLPDFLVRNSQIYGILSKGVHELTEDECKHYFPAIKTGIIVILDQQLRIIEEREALKKAELEIAQIAEQVKK